ncbi:NUDIX domain-containing protein [Pseudaestuariivita atlantica]|uniref:NUDIX hydrolase n=1 Tax=Pseudaestuariivita atlantica TaxID=1317121 RepID=A0A0L1JPM5_9RHOB|nr:NUDIX hydrolase [Pseudaestuariivita atlantica]KNG93686.1 NUDIX hydrolase [Pseudaestuariivita atlantica]
MNGRYGDPPIAGQRYTMRPGAYAILPRDGQLLLTYQDEPEPEIQLPGGGIDPGESPIPALYREAREETGWTLARPRRVLTYRRFVFMPEYDMFAEKICHIFIAHPVQRIGPPTEEGHIALWLDAEAALDVLVSPGDVDALRLALWRGLIR